MSPCSHLGATTSNLQMAAPKDSSIRCIDLLRLPWLNDVSKNTKLLNSNSTSICGFLPLCTLHSANLCMINKKFAVRHKNKLASSSYINQTEFPWKYSITWVNWDIYGGFSLRSLELVVYYFKFSKCGYTQQTW